MAQIQHQQSAEEEEEGSDKGSNKSTSATYHFSQFQDAHDPFA